ncbi:hypothetical protein GCM10017788_79170 [Amycolatopsis acidiphila]|nr:hypothetical protein GCM10017788_79170 [Amycolatopsis acidiphila]
MCGANGAVFWHADMDIDCDGQRTSQCDEDTDCCFYPDTAFHQSDDQPLNAARLPYIVVPSPSSTWNYSSAGLKGGGSCAVIYNGKIVYAVIGDTGPPTSSVRRRTPRRRRWASTRTRARAAPSRA